MEQLELAHIVRRIENGTTTLENSLKVSKMLNIHLPYNYAVPLLGIYLIEMKPCLFKNLCMKVYMII